MMTERESVDTNNKIHRLMDTIAEQQAKNERLRSDYEQATEKWRAEINSYVKEITRLQKELDGRIDNKQRELLMRSLERATGCTREEITCGPLDCALRRVREIERLEKLAEAKGCANEGNKFCAGYKQKEDE